MHAPLSAEQKNQLHASIARKYRRRKRRRPSIVELRLSELNRIALYYWPHRELPNDDDGRDHAKVVVNHLAECKDPEKRIYAWLEQWAPWAFEDDESDDDFEDFQEVIDRALDSPTRYSADSVGRAIWLDDETRQFLQIRTIGGHDVPESERIKRRLQKQAAREAIKRAANGAKPRAQSAIRTKPWAALGISRRTFYRRKQEGLL